jgi:hypothetical protein
MSGASASAARPDPRAGRAAAPSRGWRRLRFIPLAIGGATFLLGLWTGLARLGLALPGGVPAAAEWHGALMISGFLGTLISLERAVALGRGWAYAAPALSAVGALLLLAGTAPPAAGLFLLAGVLLTLNSVILAVRQPALFAVLLAVAAASWAGGTLAWLMGQPMPAVTGWWLEFLVLTVMAERLELSRLLSPPVWRQAIFVVAVSLILIGAARGEFAANAAPLSGVGLIASTLWLVVHDVARRTIRQSGQTRFSAACMLAGYFWSAAAGLLLLLVPPGTTAFAFDAAVHAITLGFILSMIFGHAPIILPAITGLRVRSSAVAYVPLAILHLSVLLRVAGDLFELSSLRELSGPATVIAIAAYAGTLIAASRGKG